MSELIQKNDNRATIRWKLLTGASAMALTAYVSSTSLARAEYSDKPQVWIELGGQVEMMSGLSSPFTPPFMLLSPTPDPYKLGSPIAAQRAPRYAVGLNGKVTFQPEGSDWIFTAGIRYGRSHAKRHVHHQTVIPPLHYNDCITFYGSSYCVSGTKVFATHLLGDTVVTHAEKHAVLDFSAGKDIGIGLLGQNGSSNVNVGVRFAQFSLRSRVDAYLRPAQGIEHPTYFHLIPYGTYRQYTMHARSSRSFNGVGLTLSWNGTAAIAGNTGDGELTLDLGVNAAFLFGRQKAKVDHTTHATHMVRVSGYPLAAPQTFHPLYPTRTHHSTRSRSVTVPNVGGFAGLSYRYSNSKISFGYRYDTFLSAMDTGIDTRKTSDLTFKGPYASISIGLP